MRAVDVNVRFATVDDAPAIVDLVESAYRGERSRSGWTTEADLLAGQRTDLAAVSTLLRAPDCRILLAEDGVAGPAACCQVERRVRIQPADGAVEPADGAVEPAGVTAYFGMFAVRPTSQRLGLGAALLSRAEALASAEWAADRMEMLVISVRIELIAWYERRGYRRATRTEPFPYGDARFGLPLRDDLVFAVLEKDLRSTGG